MKQQVVEIKGLIKSSIVPVFLLVYFVRLAIPQGSFQLFSPTVFFYTITIIFVVGYLVTIGIIGVAGIVQIKTKHIPLGSQHKRYLFLSVFGLTLFCASMANRHAYMHKEFDAAYGTINIYHFVLTVI